MNIRTVWGKIAPFAKFLLWTLAIVAISPFIFLLINGAAFRQTPDQVLVREPVERMLGAPREAANEARDDLYFALLTGPSYQRTPNIYKVKAGKSIQIN